MIRWRTVGGGPPFSARTTTELRIGRATAGREVMLAVRDGRQTGVWSALDIIVACMVAICALDAVMMPGITR